MHFSYFMCVYIYIYGVNLLYYNIAIYIYIYNSVIIIFVIRVIFAVSPLTLPYLMINRFNV